MQTASSSDVLPLRVRADEDVEPGREVAGQLLEAAEVAEGEGGEHGEPGGAERAGALKPVDYG